MTKYRSSQLEQKKKKIFRIKLILVFVILISFVFILSALSKCDFLSIKKVEVMGNKFVSTENINNIVNKHLSGNYFWFFSKNNIFIYSKQVIKNEIKNDFPRIKKVDLDLDLPNALNVNIIERIPYVLWCGNVSTTKCYLVDKEGYIFESATSDFEESLFRYYIDFNELNLSEEFTPGEIDTPIRQFVLEKNKFKEVDLLIKFIEGAGLEPYKFTKTGENYDIYFANNSKIIFNSTQNIKEVTNNLQSILNMEEFSNIENFKKLEYVDLRFGNKIFYK